MTHDPDVDAVAGALRVSIGLLVRRLRQVQAEGELTMPEISALARLDRGGPTTPGELAKLEQISPQSIGATLATLEASGFVERRSDPQDGRRAVMSLTETGLQALWNRRNAGNRASGEGALDRVHGLGTQAVEGGRTADRAAG